MNKIINKNSGQSIGVIFNTFGDDPLRRYFETLDKTDPSPKGMEWIDKMVESHFIE